MIKTRQITPENPLFGATSTAAALRIAHTNDDANTLLENSGIAILTDGPLKDSWTGFFIARPAIGKEVDFRFNSVDSLANSINSTGYFRAIVHDNALCIYKSPQKGDNTLESNGILVRDIEGSSLAAALEFEVVAEDTAQEILGQHGLNYDA